jgi:hypothetical protein
MNNKRYCLPVVFLVIYFSELHGTHVIVKVWIGLLYLYYLYFFFLAVLVVHICKVTEHVLE